MQSSCDCVYDFRKNNHIYLELSAFERAESNFSEHIGLVEKGYWNTPTRLLIEKIKKIVESKVVGS